MEALNEFTIPLEGLSPGVHQFDFQLDKSFFEHFENSIIEDGKFDMTLYFDKRPDMLVLTFDFKGSFKTDCDRCLENIDLPIEDSQQMLFKFDEEAREDDIIYITRATKMLNVAKYAYDSVGLAIPIAKFCDENDNPSCKEQMEEYFPGNKEAEEKESKDNPIWDALKDFKTKSED